MRSAIRSVLFVTLAAVAACLPPPPAAEESSASGTGGAVGTGGRANEGTGGDNKPSGTGGSTQATGGAGGNTSAPSGSGGAGGSTSTSDASSPSPDPDNSKTDAGASSDAPSAEPTPGGRPVKPSAGCGKANPPNGQRMIMTGNTQARFVVNVPANYDPQKPLPLGFAFHGYNLGDCSGGCSGYKALNAITVYPKSIGPGWEYPVNLLGPNFKFFEDMVALMKAEYCVDENRIFVAGVSSGGQFVEHLACRYGDWLWAVSPVAAYVDKGVDMACKGTPPQIIIHGVTDRAGNYGQSVAELYARRNGCTTAPTAAIAKARMEMMAAFSAKAAEYRCVNWEGCTANPVRYCIFSQITYNNLTHGWPRVGGMLIGEFLGTLK